MTSSAAFLGALFAKAAEPTIPLPTNRKLTKAGVALTAEAILKLHQLADWMELAMSNRQPDPTVVLGYTSICRLPSGVTSVSAFGALVQMFDPFKLSEAKYYFKEQTAHVHYYDLVPRVARILDISIKEVDALLTYLYTPNFGLSYVILKLRDIG